MTWYELGIWFEGRELKARQDLELEAWACANIMNCWTKRRITMNKLIGPRKGVVDVMCIPGATPDMINKMVEKARDRGE